MFRFAFQLKLLTNSHYRRKEDDMNCVLCYLLRPPCFFPLPLRSERIFNVSAASRNLQTRVFFVTSILLNSSHYGFWLLVKYESVTMSNRWFLLEDKLLLWICAHFFFCKLAKDGFALDGPYLLNIFLRGKIISRFVRVGYSNGKLVWTSEWVFNSTVSFRCTYNYYLRSGQFSHINVVIKTILYTNNT